MKNLYGEERIVYLEILNNYCLGGDAASQRAHFGSRNRVRFSPNTPHNEDNELIEVLRVIDNETHTFF